MLREEYDYGLIKLSMTNPDPETTKAGVTPDMIRKWKSLQSIQDYDETLFYSILSKNIEKMAPIIYTPTVGWLCKNFSKMFRKNRGLYLTYKDKGEIMSIVQNWPKD